MASFVVRQQNDADSRPARGPRGGARWSPVSRNRRPRFPP